jgi:hypothetical protein
MVLSSKLTELLEQKVHYYHHKADDALKSSPLNHFLPMASPAQVLTINGTGLQRLLYCETNITDTPQ